MLLLENIRGFRENLGFRMIIFEDGFFFFIFDCRKGKI